MISRLRLVLVVYVLTLLATSFPSQSLLAAQEYSLEDLYRIALEGSERIKIAEEDLYIAERVKDKVLSALIPDLSTFGSYTRYREAKFSSGGSVIQPEDSASWGFRLDQSFSLSGRELTALKVSREKIEKSRYDLYAVKEDYLFSVASAYYEVLGAKKTLEIAKANLERLAKHREAAAIRLKVGEVIKTVLLRAEAELSGARSELVRAENNLNLAKATLKRIVGLREDFDLKEEGDGNQNKVRDERPKIIDSLKQIALSERTELKSRELQKKISEKEVTYAKGAYWPTLSMEGVYTGKEESPAPSFYIKENLYGSLKINFPLFEGGLRKAEVSEALARQRQANFALEDLKKTLHLQVENAYLDFITQKGILKSLEDQLTFARDNYKASSRQFELGLANSIEVMDANTLLVTAERQLAEARYNYQLSILRLDRVTGRLLKTVVSKQ